MTLGITSCRCQLQYWTAWRWAMVHLLSRGYPDVPAPLRIWTTRMPPSCCVHSIGSPLPPAPPPCCSPSTWGRSSTHFMSPQAALSSESGRTPPACVSAQHFLVARCHWPSFLNLVSIYDDFLSLPILGTDTCIRGLRCVSSSCTLHSSENNTMTSF